MDYLNKRDANSYLPPERLAAHLTHEVTVLRARIEELEAALKEAVEALRPFSQMPIRNGSEVVCDVTPDHVGRARATLARIAAHTEEPKG